MGRTEAGGDVINVINVINNVINRISFLFGYRKLDAVSTCMP